VVAGVPAVFLPVFFLEGLAGSFFKPLATTYVLAMLASLAVALTLTPALSLMLLHGKPERKDDAPLAAWLKRAYRFMLPWFTARPGLALGPR
jgi:Cu/Ag efflux pump CusA